MTLDEIAVTDHFHTRGFIVLESEFFNEPRINNSAIDTIIHEFSYVLWTEPDGGYSSNTNFKSYSDSTFYYQNKTERNQLFNNAYIYERPVRSANNE